MENKILKSLFPERLWSEQFTIAWIVSLLTFLVFDIYWCSITTFRSLGFVQTYLFALLGATVFTLPVIVFPKRAWIQFTVWILLDILFTANIMYFRTYFTAIPASSYLLAGNLSDFKTSVTDSLRLSDSILFIISLIGYFLIRNRRYGKKSVWQYLSTLGSLAAISALASLPYKGPVNHTKYLVQQCYFTNCPPVIYTVFGKLAADILTSSDSLTGGGKKLIISWLLDHKNTLQPSDAIKECPIRRNIVFVFLESFESWPIEKSIEGQEITPNINRWLKDSTTFFAPNVVTQVGNGRSIDSQLLNLAGMLPMQNEVYAMTHSDNRYFTIPKALKELEPQTRSYILTGDKATTWNQVRVAKAFGIDTLLDVSHWKITDKIGNPPKLSDEALFSQIADKCRNGEIFPVGEPAFMQIICYSSHNPFAIPENKRHITLKGEYPEKFAEYIHAVNYVDCSLAILVEYLKSRPDWQNTSVVVIGDHEGLAVYRDKMLGHSFSKELVDPLQHTPLLIINSPVGGRFDGTMGQVDVYSTLLDIMGLHDYSWQGMGMSVLDNDFYSAAVDPKGNLIADDRSKLTESRIKKLSEARKVSDIIIKFDLFNDSTICKHLNIPY